MAYDSTADILHHIKRVNELMMEGAAELMQRGILHDLSKLKSPEKEIFDKMTPKLKKVEYGSEQYKGFLKKMEPALKHHYAMNSHHPEHYPNGIDGMNLFDLVEMMVDWKAAGERHEDGGDLHRSIHINADRFAIDAQLHQILRNTVDYIDKPDKGSLF